jgi:uncharacterized PurR-regulated membrane protein YhhQ (DUF165 family)
MTLNVLIFSRLARAGSITMVAGAIAAMVSQVIDTLIFITVSFYGERPIGNLILGQALAKVTLSLVLVPLLIAFLVWVAKRLEPDIS